MSRTVEVTVDVTEAAGLGDVLHTRATVTLPERGDVPRRPIVCFGFPGGSYSRGYYTFAMPGSNGVGQAGWHADRGWVFVSCDHVSVGDSTSPADPTRLTIENLAAANAATVEHIWARLLSGTLADDVRPLIDPVRLGIGQSMGGFLVMIQQGQHGTFDGIGLLGDSVYGAEFPVPPELGPMPTPHVPRGQFPKEAPAAFGPRDDGLPIATYGFHYDDEPEEIVRRDMLEWPTRQGEMPSWGTPSIPLCALSMASPGAGAVEAALVEVPIFLGWGERDVCQNPLREAAAFRRTSDVTIFVCPRMCHMHNFASTRERFWSRIEAWGSGVASDLAHIDQ
jgi:hypothetical protein